MSLEALKTLSLESRVLQLENEILRLKELMAASSITMGRVHSYHDLLEMDGFTGSLDELIAHGNNAIEGHKINRACLRVGDNSAHCLSETGRSGPLGVARGVSGRFLSLVDTLPAGVATEVE